jgi:Ca-activated chloride channel family protein
MIQEVIALAKKYTFVTPYTSFLAAPRALLRPRSIKPGDPILRVRTDAAIESVIAVFPFGLTKPLHYIADEDVWEVRFLAPKEMNDGTYFCNLLLTDLEGNLYEEKKEFIIDSRPPSLSISTDKENYLPGEEVEFRVQADRDTRRILIRLGSLAPVEARYRTAAGASVARLRLPLDMPPGEYTVKISAVDFARNSTVLEKILAITAR